MNTKRTKLIAIAAFTLPLAMFLAFRTAPTPVGAATLDDPAAVYKAKCQACHTPTAGKFFDPAKSEDEHVEAILKGKKGEKPPFMPSYGDKGMTADDAKALNAYMKSLRAS